MSISINSFSPSLQDQTHLACTAIYNSCNSWHFYTSERSSHYSSELWLYSGRVFSFIFFFCYKCHYYFLEVVVQILWNIVAQRTTVSIKRNSSDHEVNWYKEKRMLLCFSNGILYSSKETNISVSYLKCLNLVCVCVRAEKRRERQWDLKL